MTSTAEHTFAIWAPDGSRWSEWAKPVAFVQLDDATIQATPGIADAATLLETPDLDSAIIVDVSGRRAVQIGLALAARGFRPVPLFNGTSGPAAVIDIVPLQRALVEGAECLNTLEIPPDAPPAFLLDSRRHGRGVSLSPGAYDNRWIVLPQDFPSGLLLVGHEIRAAVVIQDDDGPVANDLAHVLRRWQEVNVRIRLMPLTNGRQSDITIPKPSGFRTAWYTAVALLGLRRSNVGGFGAQIPSESARGG